MVKALFVIGRYPTPVEPLAAFSTLETELWVKRDDLTGSVYGGNKVRKLEGILEKAAKRGAKRLVTIGAAGSHHVLATTLYGKAAGFPTAAILTPQPRTEHVAETLRAALGLGLEAHPVRSIADIPRLLAKLRRRGDMLIPPGGSNVAGTRGYLDGAEEVAEAIRAGTLGEPDAIVVALGSGGTAAGILAGLVRAGLSTRVIGVRVVEPLLSGRLRTVALAMAATRAAGFPIESTKLASQLEADGRWLGPGYGHPTEAGERAMRLGREQGLSLDPTYTAKAFAAALDLVESGRFRRLLYWHTLSSAPFAPLLESAPTEAEIPPDLRALFLPESGGP